MRSTLFLKGRSLRVSKDVFFIEYFAIEYFAIEYFAPLLTRGLLPQIC